MSWKSLVSLSLSSIFFLAACNPIAENSNTVDESDTAIVSTTETTLSDGELARSMAKQMSISLVPVIEINNPLQAFGDQLATDADNIDVNQLMAFVSAYESIFDDLTGLIAMALTEDPSTGELSSINSSLIDPANYNFIAGVSAIYVDTNHTLTINAESVVGSYEGESNTATGGFTVYLPATTVIKSTVSYATTGLTFTDSKGTKVSSASSSIDLIFDNDLQDMPYTDLVSILGQQPDPIGFDIALEDGQIVLADKITLQGAGSFSAQTQSYFDENWILGFDVVGSIQNSLANKLTASAVGSFGYQYNYGGEDETETSLAELEVNLDLTESNESNAYILANLLLDLNMQSVYSDSHYDEDLSLEVDIELTVDESKWGFYSELNYQDYCEYDQQYYCGGASVGAGNISFALRDLTISGRIVQMEFYMDSDYDFEAQTIIIGKITVDGKSHAEVILNTDDGSIYADFIVGQDEVMVSAAQIDSLNSGALNGLF